MYYLCNKIKALIKCVQMQKAGFLMMQLRYEFPGLKIGIVHVMNIGISVNITCTGINFYW